MNKLTEVMVSVQDKLGNVQMATLSISKSPVSEFEIGYRTNESGQVIFQCEQGNYEFNAYGENGTKGKVEVSVQGYLFIRVGLVIE